MKYVHITKTFLLLLIFFPSITSSWHVTKKIKKYSAFEQELFEQTNVDFTDQKNIFSEKNSKNHSHIQPKKPWTFIVYIAADNDLRPFAANNIKQMTDIGSTNNINVLVHLDIRMAGNKKITRRYYIEKNKLTHVNCDDPHSQSMDSGNANTLISCCDWAITHYPAENYALILWNHGTGIIDPNIGKVIHPSELFSFNPQTNKYELDRSVGFLDFIQYVEKEKRGLCWDTTTGNYLTNQKLDQALNHICSNILKGKKFSIIGFDACLMSMLEVGNLIKPYAHVMVGSQEVELGMGWNYAKVLAPFTIQSMNTHQFASHIVAMYGETYRPITNDFTQSAVNLDTIEHLENNINSIALLLIECFKYQINQSVKRALMLSRNRQACTHFDEPTYIDLHNWLTNLNEQLPQIKLSSHSELIPRLLAEIKKGLNIIEEVSFANSAGSNLSKAKGISIYFPEHRIHNSYTLIPFAKTNGWLNLVNMYLQR